MYQVQRNDLLPLIPASRRILDVGCCTGELGEALKKRGAYVAGVEIDADAAAVASHKLDQVVTANVEEALPFEEKSFDCIIYGDVIEHLVDPWAAVRTQSSLVTSGGTVITSIPNVQYWRVVQNLIRGHWDYTKGGSLDWGHLRFFTLSSMTTLLEQSGYADVEVFQSAAGRFSTALYKLLPARLRPLLVFRYYLRATKK